MIVGGSKRAVVEHIRKLATAGDLNAKAELSDPTLAPEQSAALVAHFYKIRRNRPLHAIRRQIAYQAAARATREMRSHTTLVGLENLREGPNLSSGGIFPSGAIVTSNHFNPLDSILPLEMAKKLKKRLFIVSQESNLALPKPLNFLTNNMDLIPLALSPHYIAHQFKPELSRILAAGHLVLIYPEEEMWFNYRKPRPCRRGAYQFAAECGVPIISCFTTMQELPARAPAAQPAFAPDNDEFYKLSYDFRILGVLRPDPAKSPRENSIALAEQDYALKKRAYERIYGQPLDYSFSDWDIAGWRG